MPQTTPFFYTAMTVMDVSQPAEIMAAIGWVNLITVVTAGAGSPDIVFSDMYGNVLYTISAANLVDGQAISA